MNLRFLAALTVVAALPAGARAQNRCPSCMDSVSGQWHMLPALGLRAGIPQKASAAVGIVAGRNYRERGHTEDVAVYVEPGLSAGRASIGYISGFGNMGSGFGFAGTAMRTWKDPINLSTNATYLGGELWAWPMFFTGPRLGIFRRVNGGSKGWFFTADFGFGL
jgi:hypothetical protein